MQDIRDKSKEDFFLRTKPSSKSPSWKTEYEWLHTIVANRIKLLRAIVKRSAACHASLILALFDTMFPSCLYWRMGRGEFPETGLDSSSTTFRSITASFMTVLYMFSANSGSFTL